MPAQETQKVLKEHSRDMESSMGKLSSGTRVRSAADDPASLAIGIKHQSNIKSQGQALRNANDSISELQVAEGALSEVSAMMTRLKELSVQAANSTQDDKTRSYLNQEYLGLRKEIERITRNTNFRGESLFRPKQAVREFQIGVDHSESSRLVLNAEDFVLSEFNMSLADSTVVTNDDALLNLGYIDKAIDKVSSVRAKIGSFQNRINSSISNLEISRLNESNAYSRRMDVDYASETSNLVNSMIKQEAATAVMGQANNLGSGALKIIG